MTLLAARRSASRRSGLFMAAYFASSHGVGYLGWTAATTLFSVLALTVSRSSRAISSFRERCSASRIRVSSPFSSLLLPWLNRSSSWMPVTSSERP